MADETTTTTLTELIQTSINQARVTPYVGVDLSTLVTNRPLEEGKGSVSFPIYDKQSMASVAEGTDLANTAFQTTDVEITPGEKGLMTTLTRLAKRRAKGQTAVDIGRVMGEAYAEIKNTEIYALFDGFSQAIGTTNVDITEALIQEGVALLRAAGAPTPYYMPVTAYVLEDLLGLYSSNTNSTAASIMEQVQVSGILPMIHGVIPVFIQLPAGTGTGQQEEPDTKTAIFSGQAIGFVNEFDFDIANQADESLRADELVAVSSFGVGEIKDTWGVELLVDNKD